jgi:hypothetical protein
VPPKSKEPKASGVGILEIRLGCCLSEPTKAMAADLHHLSQRCSQVANAMLKKWLVWHDQNPNYEPQQLTSRGNPKVNAKGEPVLEPAWLPQGLSKYLYRLGSEVAPEIGGTTICQIHKNVTAMLDDKLPRGHEGKAKKRWQGILWNEVNPQTFRPGTIPIYNQSVRLCYSGCYDSKKVSARSPLGKQILLHGKHQAVVAFQLWSKDSGRANTNLICRIETRQLSDGNRRILQRIAKGEWKLCDSDLVWKEGRYGGWWSFQLTYQQPINQTLLDKERQAVLKPSNAAEEQPFVLEEPGGKKWKIGDSRVLKASYRRLEMRRRIMRERYRDAGSAKRGHGRERIEQDIRPITRQIRDMSSHFTKRMVDSVVKFCVRYDCGFLRYEEATLWGRAHGWFAENNLPFDWTLFENLLRQKMTLLGMSYDKQRVKKAKVGAETGEVVLQANKRAVLIKVPNNVLDSAGDRR